MDRARVESILNEIDVTLTNVEEKPRQGYYFWLEEFARLTRPKTVVELGTYYGTSAYYLLKGLPETSTLTTVDTSNLSNLEYDSRLTIVVGNDLSDKVWESIPSEIDLLFIDSDHNAEQCLQEIEKYKQKMAPICYLILDDINLSDMAGVWDSIEYPKYDLRGYHETGFALFIIAV